MIDWLREVSESEIEGVAVDHWGTVSWLQHCTGENEEQKHYKKALCEVLVANSRSSNKESRVTTQRSLNNSSL